LRSLSCQCSRGHGGSTSGSLALSRCVDLEFGEVDEDLLHVCPSQGEVFDNSSLKEGSQSAERLRQSHIATLNVDAIDAVSDLDWQSSDLHDSGLGVRIDVFCRAVMDQLG